jgi:DnaK suppressor protein
MNNDEKKELISRLETEKKRLASHIKDLKELTQPIEPDCAIGRVSCMDAINNKSVNEAALRTAERKLKKIEETFKRVDDPMFGVCRKCGAKIPSGRLIIMPESTTCVKCSR